MILGRAGRPESRDLRGVGLSGNKDKDSWIVKCPKCGRIFDSCDHVSREDVERIVRLLREGIEVYENEDEMEDYEREVQQDESQRASLATLIEPRFSLKDVVLAPKAQEAIEDALLEYRHKNLIFRRWGLSKVIRKKKGLVMLFAGPPGTGKTLTAETIAKAIGKPLMLVSYAQLENMWVGETEKNIETVFKKAEANDAVLFFDEADAVFHRRGYANAPWTNRDVNVLLSHLENFGGVAILATNMVRVMDKALDRRIDIAVEFEMPNAEMRLKIFKKLVPPEAPLADDVDFDLLARKFELSGGSILNVIRQAMRNALRRGKRRRITMEDFVRAAQREAEKSSMMRKDHLSSRGSTREPVGGYI